MEDSTKQNVPPHDARPKPALRTMKTDVAELFKTTRPTLTQMIGPVEGSRKVEKGRTKNYYAIAMVVLLVAVLGGALYWFSQKEQETKTVSTKIIPPAPFFITETSRTLTVNAVDRLQLIHLIEDSVNEKERYGSVKRLLVKIKDGEQERFATINDFLGFYHITLPQEITAQLDMPLMVFVYYAEDGSRLGFVTKVKNQDRALVGMLTWEPSLVIDLQPFFFGETPKQILSAFEDRTYRNIDWRFLKLAADRDFGIAYMVFPARNLLALTMSKGAMEAVINRLFEAR